MEKWPARTFCSCEMEYATSVEVNETAMLLARLEFTPQLTSVCRFIH